MALATNSMTGKGKIEMRLSDAMTKNCIVGRASRRPKNKLTPRRHSARKRDETARNTPTPTRATSNKCGANASKTGKEKFGDCKPSQSRATGAATRL